MAKRYYWLKLKDDFFSSKEIKKLRKIAGGDTYTIIYLKLMLLSLKDDGKIFYEGIEDSFAEEIALDIDEDVDNVKVTISFLMSKGLMEEINQSEVNMTMVKELTGSEGESARRMRQLRTRSKNQELLGNRQTSQCDGDVTEKRHIVQKCDIEIEKEKEIEKELDIEKNTTAATVEKKKKKSPERVKHKHGEYQHVLLTDEQVEKLNENYGSDFTKECIRYLDEYIEMKGYKAKNHYLCITKWVYDAVNRQSKQRGNNSRAYKLSNGVETSNPFIRYLDETDPFTNYTSKEDGI